MSRLHERHRLGLLITFIALESPIDRGGDLYLFSLHMVQHMLLMMVAPPLILLGIAGARPSPRERHTTLRTVWWATGFFRRH